MKMIPFLVMGMMVLNSCEGELDDLGSQLVNGNEANGNETAYSLVAYNISNKDTIQADASKIDSVRLGAFKESVFGGQKVSYITQVRLATYNPDFGKNPVVDSVVLTMKPRYETATDSVKTTTNEDYIYPDGAVAAKKVVTTYPVSKYGKAKIDGKTKFTIRVHEVDDFLGGTSDKLSSNKVVALNSNVIGSKVFDGTVNSVVVTKDSDASELLNRSVSLRMKLDSAFFQNKLIAKQGNQVLKDVASFIRYFKGISISVLENDGYLFSMAPNDTAITIYYKNDVTATDGTVTRTKAELALNLGSGNVHLSQIIYDRAGSDYSGAISDNNAPNDISGDEVIYTQGMGGASFGIRIPDNTVARLREMYKNEKIGIVSAKIRLYNDETKWNNSYRKPSSFLVRERGATKDSIRFLPDMTALSSAGYTLIRTANLGTKDAYYEIGITKSLKDIVEAESVIRGFRVDVGGYLIDNQGILLGQNFNTRAYSPFRVVLKGTGQQGIIGDAINKESKVAQLRIIFTKK
ncbi:DUF4270 family protein [Chryseobacterium sp. KACC 21268]|nr:DUF4270 family protein [Chryseobacterium sp. KACC 21268]